MARKVLLVNDPGIDGAFAVATALFDRELTVLGLGATAGNISAEQATRNVHLLIEQLDPPRFPRLGSALPIDFEIHARDLHGPSGLGDIDLPISRLHQPPTTDRMIAEIAREFPHEVTLVVMGPCTALAQLIDRDPESAHLLERLIVVGGSWHAPGDFGPVTEFHFACDPVAARKVLRSELPIMLVPLDVSRKLLLSPSDLLQLPEDGPPAARFLRKLVPSALNAMMSKFGVEGLFVADVLGLIAASHPELFTVRRVAADVELRGTLTTGMSVFDTRWGTNLTPGLDVATDVDLRAVRQSLRRILQGG
jgi:inosine-uridine nucleoside N-ribohydrolase